MDSIPYWFKGARFNFAENILYSASSNDKSRRTTAGKEDDKIAITEFREGCTQIRDLSWRELRRKVGHLSQAMRAAGVKRGTRIAVVAGNSIDTAVTFLAVTALGGIFSSSSADTGIKGLMDRLLQIEPMWVFADGWVVHNGK
jgi:acetoacetyl-CoA synthetase